MGKRFDELIELREHIPEDLRRYLKQARLFEFDILPTETFEHVDLDKVDTLAKSMVIPYPVVAIEDKAGVVIIISDKDKLLDTRVKRRFITYTKAMEGSYANNPSDDEFMRSHGYSGGQIDESIIGSKMVYTGTFFVDWGSDVKKWIIDQNDCGVETGYVYISNLGQEADFDFRDNEMAHLTDERYPLCNRDFQRAVITAYEELLPLGDHDKVFLREEPVFNDKERKRLPKYRKTCHRAKYTIVKPKEARRIMQLPDPTPKKEGGRVIKDRRAHWRSEHEHTFKHDKWGDKVGTTIMMPKAFVPAIWNGDDEAEVGNKRYKVVYDTYSKENA